MAEGLLEQDETRLVVVRNDLILLGGFAEEADIPSEHEISPTNGQEIPPGTFHGGLRFDLDRGGEVGYHCHVYSTSAGKRIDTGLLLTVVGVDMFAVFAENHREGKVSTSRRIQPSGLTSKQRMTLGEMAIDEIGAFPEEARRMPSEGKAEKIHERKSTRLSQVFN